MEILILGELKAEKYKNLMNYAFKKCNIVAFDLTYSIKRSEDEYCIWIMNNLKKFRPNLLKKEIDPYEYDLVGRYYYNITPEIKQFLMDIEENKGIYNFYNPQDISLLNNDTVWLKMISHENMCLIYCSEKETEEIKELGFEYKNIK